MYGEKENKIFPVPFSLYLSQFDSKLGFEGSEDGFDGFVGFRVGQGLIGGAEKYGVGHALFAESELGSAVNVEQFG